jgi:hypothetical protein
MRLLSRLRPPHLPLEGLELVLRAGRALPLVGARGVRLQCLEGCTWITQPGDCRDIYLAAGEGWQVTGDGRVLIEAVDRAVVTLRR